MPLADHWPQFTRGRKITLGVIAFLVLLEGRFDIAEIILGQFMLWTNNKRPQVGRLWTEEKRDLDGQTKATTLIDSLRQQPLHERYIRSLDDLAAYLAYKSGLQLSRREFLELYRTLPAADAGRIMDPILLRELATTGNWNSVKLTDGGEKIWLLFLDAYGQPIFDTGVLLGSPAALAEESHLADQPGYQHRLIAADRFRAAYTSLPVHLQMQIINDPRRWQEYDPRLIAAAVSPWIRNGAVTIALEIAQAGSATITEMQASELATAYLIAALNQADPDLHYELPRKEQEHE